MATFKVSTKVNKDSPAIITTLSVKEGNPQVAMALAMQALVVKLQGTWRKSGIPATFECNMDDYAPGTRHAAAPMTPSDIINKAKSDPVFRAQVLEGLK